MTIDHREGEEPTNVGFNRLTMPFNATSHLAPSVPCWFDAAGLLIGLQVVGAPRGDAELFGIAQVYEQAVGWSRRRPAFERLGKQSL